MSERPIHIPAGIPAASRPLRARGRVTMARLMDAGLEVLAEDGWHDASIDAVVVRAGAAHGTFYRYFANKQDLLLTLAHECAAVMVELVSHLDAVGPGAAGRDAVRSFLVRFLDAYDRYQGVVRAWMESQVDHPDLRALGEDVMGAFAARFIALTGDPMRAAALLALLERSSYGLAARGVRIGRDRMLDTLTTIVHRGFLSPAAPAATSS
ncbi:MAG TPA: TetR/AcrR family transcriptional regulator [Acidimicrobiales bacterium]|nr:TetR/AcrR family transcriptional regulator [Acidimicrobiales bacterium]